MSPLFLGLSINGIVLSSDLIASDPFRFQATYRSAVPNIIGGSCDYVGIPRRTQVALTTQRGQHIPLKCLSKHCCVGGTWHRRSLSPLRMRECVRGFKRRQSFSDCRPKNTGVRGSNWLDRGVPGGERSGVESGRARWRW